MRIIHQLTQTIMTLQSNEELDKVFSMDHRDFEVISRYFYDSDKQNDLKVILSGVEFRPDVKLWLETNLSHDAYWVVWRTVRDISNFQLRYSADLFFKDSKQATIFRLTWL